MLAASPNEGVSSAYGLETAPYYWGCLSFDPLSLCRVGGAFSVCAMGTHQVHRLAGRSLGAHESPMYMGEGLMKQVQARGKTLTLSRQPASMASKASAGRTDSIFAVETEKEVALNRPYFGKHQKPSQYRTHVHLVRASGKDDFMYYGRTPFRNVHHPATRCCQTFC